MVVHDADAKLFEKTLEAAVAKGILKGKPRPARPLSHARFHRG